jgi:acyl-CoA thioesterase FadM
MYTMEIVTIETLKKQTDILFFNNYITMTIPENWVIQNENRISYLTQTKIIEGCRDYHWQKFSLKLHNLCDQNIDSVCRIIKSKYVKPIIINTRIIVEFKIIYINNNSYKMIFKILDYNKRYLYSLYNMHFVFYDNHQNKLYEISQEIVNKLRKYIKGEKHGK